jgi:hypothetical protein
MKREEVRRGTGHALVEGHAVVEKVIWWEFEERWEGR